MARTEQRSFGHVDREAIYEYVEQHGHATREELEGALDVDPSGLRHHLAILKRDKLLEETEGGYEVHIDTGAEEEHRDEEISFRIRPAHQSDLSGIVGVIRQVTENGSYIVAESVAQVLDHEDILLRHNEIESRVFFVATVDDDVIGWVHLEAPEFEKLGHTAELTVGVLEEFRGHGIGSHLLERGLEWAGSNGFEKVYQSVPATNEEAIAFLEANGWDIEAVRRNHYLIDGAYVDEMMLEVTI